MDEELKLKISMDRTNKGHALLVTNLTGERKFCAESHCRGNCGWPALFLRRYYDMESPLEREAALASSAQQDTQGRFYRDYKAHGAMVACGPVWQKKRWDGEREYLPAKYETDSTILDMMWW